jgi:hypothetical protein
LFPPFHGEMVADGENGGGEGEVCLDSPNLRFLDTRVSIGGT